MQKPGDNWYQAGLEEVQKKKSTLYLWIWIWISIKLRFLKLQTFFSISDSQNGPWNSSINITWEFVRCADPWAPPRSTESETEDRPKSLLKQTLQVILLHAKVWEPLIYDTKYNQFQFSHVMKKFLIILGTKEKSSVDFKMFSWLILFLVSGFFFFN